MKELNQKTGCVDSFLWRLKNKIDGNATWRIWFHFGDKKIGSFFNAFLKQFSSKYNVTVIYDKQQQWSLLDSNPRDHFPDAFQFVEMDELRGSEWQEVSRWMKFEEDLLEGAERWGR